MTTRLVQGNEDTLFLPVTPSTAIDAGDLLTFTSGKLVKAGAATAAVDIVGRLGKTIASTDDDYADDRLVQVLVPKDKYNLYRMDTSSAVATDVGLEVDLSDESTVDRGNNSVKVVKIMKVISATEVDVMVKFNGAY